MHNQGRVFWCIIRLGPWRFFASVTDKVTFWRTKNTHSRPQRQLEKRCLTSSTPHKKRHSFLMRLNLLLQKNYLKSMNIYRTNNLKILTYKRKENGVPLFTKDNTTTVLHSCLLYYTAVYYSTTQLSTVLHSCLLYCENIKENNSFTS